MDLTLLLVCYVLYSKKEPVTVPPSIKLEKV